MKKILAFLLAAVMLSAMFVLPSAAADNANYAVDFNFVITKPVQDGVVRSGEYGDHPIHTFSQSKSQFVFNKGHTKYNKWDFDFYAAWDANALYLAWVVRSDIHGPVPKAELGDQGEIIGSNYENNQIDTLQKMWMFSCVQFVITPGNPTIADYETNKNYLEVGFCEMEDGFTGRAVWSIPIGVSSDDIDLDQWEAVVVRNDAAETTTYEIAIPWEKSGLNGAGINKKFGLAYVVSTQESYYAVNGKAAMPAMIEWQNVMLTGSSRKLANNCAIVTMNLDDIIDEPDVKISIDCGRGGSTSPSDDFYVDRGMDFVIDIIPDEGYVIKSLLVNDVSVEEAEGLDTTYYLELNRIREEVEIEVEFEKFVSDDESGQDSSDTSDTSEKNDDGDDDDESGQASSNAGGGNVSDTSDTSEKTDDDDDDDDKKSSKRKKSSSIFDDWLPIAIIGGVALLLLVVIIITIIIAVKTFREGKNDEDQE